MTTQEFETVIKEEIDPRLEVLPHPYLTDIERVSLNYPGKSPIHVCGIPANEIREERNPDYQDAVGHIHPSIEECKTKIRVFLEKLKDPEFLDLYE